jgi:prolyl-tRNA editing enzyme YbaK/EbsC (Cys-tRNA(Pro) deacylase)
VALTLALAGDTMLGRRVAERLAEDPCAPLLDPKLVETARSADLFLLNLECCISAGGAPIDEPGKPFFFRAPPLAAERLAEIGVRCVTLANNHVLDFGADALADTLAHLAAVGIATVGAGRDLDQARAATILSAAGQRLRVIAVTDHPASYAAGRRRPGTAFADLAGGSVPDWLRDAANPRCGEYALVTAHWGSNMTAAPVAHVRNAAAAIELAGATLVVGHSAHVPHGVSGRVLYDLGDFLDDYAVHSTLRNDLSLLWLVTLEEDGPRRIEGVPVRLEYAYTRPADETETVALARLMSERCAAVGSRVAVIDGRLVFDDRRPAERGRPPPRRDNVGAAWREGKERGMVNDRTRPAITYLGDRGVEYELVEHEERFTAAAEARASGVEPQDAAKVLVLRRDDRYVLAVIPASHRLSLTKASELLGVEDGLRLASEDEIRRDFAQFEVGAVPPLGDLLAVDQLVDSRLLDHDRVLCSSGDHRHGLRIDPNDLVRLANAPVGDISED